MFGYINPDVPYLFKKDERLYGALYCGMCRSIGRGCGSMPKTALTYDVAFMSAILHNIAAVDVKVERRRCGLHIFKRRFMAAPDDISLTLGCVNTALTYHKLLDDKLDGDAKGALAFAFKRGFKRAAKRHPQAVAIIEECMAAQRGIEGRGSAVIDEACEPTAVMLEKLSRYLLGGYATEATDRLFYAIGKWIYLADALDDYDKDVKKGRYNVLFNAYGCKYKSEAVRANGEEINFLFDSLFADMRKSLADVTFHFNHDLTDNIILRGIPVKTRALVYGKCGQGKSKNEQTQS